MVRIDSNAASQALHTAHTHATLSPHTSYLTPHTLHSIHTPHILTLTAPPALIHLRRGLGNLLIVLADLSG